MSQGNITACSVCPVDTYSDGNGPCMACPQHSTTNDNTGQTFCICRSGFSLVTDPATGVAVSPLQCADINECEGENNCHEQATCTNSTWPFVVDNRAVGDVERTFANQLSGDGTGMLGRKVAIQDEVRVPKVLAGDYVVGFRW